MSNRISPDEREDAHAAFVAEFLASDKGDAAKLSFRLQLARLGMTATQIDEEIRNVLTSY